MLGKKHRIRTYTVERINDALNEAGIFPVPETEVFDSNTDEV